ncbi:SAM-dependent methyltransferase [Streptomyces sp. DSM 44915]|uniref:SAM-dependent methyltransferase n=1 Tax=Streptomyces chisholmiae TaxID=3075540 RepID=A0ABU2JP47_9ACTN|nr:SAM-dependent methyltransferase [Streptomyces sp. DSM 44915]MDT0266763.1 SAM-dependent methyltransferase [Streptomyces sp. DSM 44915]
MVTGQGDGQSVEALDLRTDQPHSARMYDYLLGGKDHYTVDAEAAEAALAPFPLLRTAARENRAFLGRAVRHLVREAGIRQFLDLGSGLPTAENVHQVAQRVDPLSRVVYVDNDPIVLVHGSALLARDALTAVIQGDIRQPEAVLSDPQVRSLLDFEQPMGVLAVAVLHFVSDEEDPEGLVGTLREAVAPGSHFILSHATADIAPEAAMGVQRAYRAQGVPLTLRDRDRFTGLFEGLSLIDPGVQVVCDWRNDDVAEADRPDRADVSWYGGIGRLD